MEQNKQRKISEYDALCILETAIPGLTCEAAKEMLIRLKESGITEPIENQIAS